MTGFVGIRDWVDAPDNGRSHLTTFRKQVASTATLANDWVDYTYFSGNPPANFYASSPLEAEFVEQSRGILVPDVYPLKQFLRRINVMSSAASATSTTSQKQSLILLDYLLYYPFIDTDALGEEQFTTASQVLTRYTTGEGVMIMAVAQSAASSVGTFTVNYTNSDGVSGRTSDVTYTKAVAGGGTLISSTTNVIAGSQPFIQLQAGDKGVRSIESVTFSAAGGGLMALVLVKPIQHFYSTQECRRTTTGNLESYGAASQFESVIHMQPVEIQRNAVLGVIGRGNAGSLASSVLVGTLETLWS